MLILEEYIQTENTFNNKKYKISFGKLYDENLTEIINFSWKENGLSANMSFFISSNEGIG